MTPQLRAAFDQERNERANELFEIAELLVDAGLTADASPISLAAGQCRRATKTAGLDQPDAGREYWSYEVVDLRINVDVQRHFRPRTAVMDEAVAVLSMTVHEYVPTSLEEVGASYDLLRRLDTDFHLDVHQVVEDERYPLRTAWHVDTHLHTDSSTHEVHPRFHVQIGGEKLDEVDASIRAIFVPEAPRFPSAPLDGILAIDFVLAHYCGERWNLLRHAEPRFGRLRKRPMQRYWSPYFRTLAEGIDNLDADLNGGAAGVLLPNIFAA